MDTISQPSTSWACHFFLVRCSKPLFSPNSRTTDRAAESFGSTESFAQAQSQVSDSVDIEPTN